MSRDILQLSVITAGISKACLSMGSDEERGVKEDICRTYTPARMHSHGDPEEGVLLRSHPRLRRVSSASAIEA